MRRTALTLILALFLGAAAQATPWPPRDPNEHDTTVDFSEAWALRLQQSFRTLGDIQRAAGAKGKIMERSLSGRDPSVSFHWRSVTPDGMRGSFMLVQVYRSGKLEVSISTEERALIDFDSNGNVSCWRCVAEMQPKPQT